MTYVDQGAPYWRAVVNGFGKPVEYTPYGGGAPFTITMFITRLKNDKLFGAALQHDILGVVDAIALETAMPGRPRPLKFDKLATLGRIGMRYTVEDWHGSPHYGDDPVVFKLLLSGGAV